MLQTGGFLHILKKTGFLKHIFIQFRNQSLYNTDYSGPGCSEYFEAFCNLTSLELYNLDGPPGCEIELIENISDVLTGCPSLKSLCLALVTEIANETMPMLEFGVPRTLLREALSEV